MSTVATKTKPSLGWLIKENNELSVSSDSQTLADEVLAMIDPSDYAFYLRQAIVSRLSSETSSARTAVTPNIRKGVSTKQSIIRDEFWPKFLQQRIFVAGRAITLADASSDDLRAVAESRRNQAAELTYRAEQFETLADLMDKSRVSRLEALDPASASTAIGRAA